MPVLFPTSLDTSTFPTAATLTAETLATEPHSKLHGDLGTAILHLETKIGIDSSADTNSLDYKINHVAAIPVGTLFPFAGATPPTNYLICNGASLSTTGTYAALFAVIAYNYGGSGGSFLLPDLRGRAVIGLDNMGGTAASRVAPATSLGQNGGFSDVALATNQLPAHTHAINHDHGSATTDTQGNHAHWMNTGFVQSGIGAYGANGGQTNIVQTTTDGAHAHNFDMPAFTGTSGDGAFPGNTHTNLQPYIAVNYIIRY